MIRRIFFIVSAATLFFSRGAYAQHDVIVQPPGTDASEVCIAVDPLNPAHLVAGANLDFVYRSFDGGATWLSGRLNSSVGVWGDPCAFYDDQGTAYYAHLSNPPRGDGWWIDRIVVARSVSGGAIWNDGAQIGKRDSAQQDKAWLACDLSSSQRHGTLYMTWTEFDRYGSHNPADSSRILFSSSNDYADT